MSARQIIHVDMDAFYASVEQRDHPELRGKPVVVGGSARRGVVAAASYEARVFGIHSAMPMAEAMRRCSDLIVVRGDHGRYGEVSADIFAIFHRFTPLVEGLSLDEAFLDVTGSRALFGDGVAIARAIRAAIHQELNLTASAGVAPCKFAAKIASDLEKPDGLVVVGEDVRGFLAPLPLERMWGIGPVAAEKMHAAGFSTIGDLASAEARDLEALLGSWGGSVHRLANGLDDRDVIAEHAARSIGAEETFDDDVRSIGELERHLLAQSQRVARRLFEKGIFGRVVTVKLKFADFTLRTVRMTLPEPIADTDSLFEAARELLRRAETGRRPIRLTGVSVSDLSTGPVQRDLFSDPRRVRREKIEAVSDAIRSRFGDRLLTRASLLDRRR